uniref:Putative cytosine deaminase n=1 Tax=Paulinella longichromatophora TaxID=1708747 RepID=A0A2H4ZNX0_9EUKA|nr:putative cytosine deaminase [Paulinella longichromatophora]
MHNNLAVQIPRDLLDPYITNLPVPNSEGLVPVILTWDQGKITQIKPFKYSHQTPLPLALTPFIEPHSHIDKAYSNSIRSDVDNGMSQSLFTNSIEHSFRTTNLLQKRINYSLQRAWMQGLRGIRTHIDTFGPTGQSSWEILQDLRLQWKNRIALQLVALTPLYYWGTHKGITLAKQVAKSGGLLGGVIGPPYSKTTYLEDEILVFLQLAQSLDCSVDLHIDESSIKPGTGVSLVTSIVEKYQFDISITCSHSSSMGLLPLRDSRRLAERMASVNLQVVSLPFTNFWLLGRLFQATPVTRPIAPIHQLQAAGVNVSIGSDNIQDAWFPGGNFNIVELMFFSTLVTHLTPWSRQGLSLFTTSPSRLMGLEWDGVFRIGSPADILLFDCEKWQSLLYNNPKRQILKYGQWIV